MSFFKSKRPFIMTQNGYKGEKDFSINCSRYNRENGSQFSQSFHNYSIIRAALEKAIDRRDFALSTALLMNEGYSFDFSLIASINLAGGEA